MVPAGVPWNLFRREQCAFVLRLDFYFTFSAGNKEPARKVSTLRRQFMGSPDFILRMPELKCENARVVIVVDCDDRHALCCLLERADY